MTFAYPSNPEKNVLQNASLYFPAGEMTFVIGRSGSGKSTVGNLVSKFYDPWQGTVRLGGKNLQDLNIKWLRERVVLIQQSSNLFTDTLFTNVALGHKHPKAVPAEAVSEACDMAMLQATISSLPNGLETVVGPQGHNLSGGQKQRVALARAILRDPEVLILDEVTSGLDHVTKAAVIDAIRAWRQDKTTIIITHDVSQIQDDDFLYVMEEAQVVQKGFKGDLLQANEGPIRAFAMPPKEAEEYDSDAGEPGDPEDRALSPDTPMLSPNTFTRLSRFIFEDVQSQPLRRRFSERASIGTRAVHVAQLMDQAWLGGGLDTKRSSMAIGEDFSVQPLQLSRHVDDRSKRSSIAIDADLALQPRRLSKYLDERFASCSTPDRLVAKDADLEPTPRDSVDITQYPSIQVTTPSPTPSQSWPDSSGSCYEEDVDPPEEAPQQVAPPRPASIEEPVEQAESLPSTDHLDVEKAAKKTKEPGSIFKTLASVWPALDRHDRGILVLGLVLTTIEAALAPAFAYCFSALIAASWAPPGEKLATGAKWAIIIACIAVVAGTLHAFSRYLMEKAAQRWVNSVRAQAFDRILRQSRPWYDRSKNAPGRLVETLERNAEEMRNIVGRMVPILLSVLTVSLMSIIWAIVISWNLTLVVLAAFPALIIAVKVYTYLSGIWETRCNEVAEDASAMKTEILLNIRVVRSLTLECFFGEKYAKSVASVLNTGYKRAVYTSPAYGAYQAFSYPITALIYYYGVVVVTNGSGISTTSMVQVVNLLLFGLGVAASALGSLPQLTMAQATAVQMLEFANLPRDAEHRGTARPETTLPIRMKDLTFSYSQDSDDLVLKGVSLTIHPNQCTAIVGLSGGGKSTLAAILLGLHSPAEPSSLSFGGVPFAALDIRHLRQRISYVSQTPFLFPGTIAENIAYGLPDDSPYRRSHYIYRAAKQAGIHDYVSSLSQGYATVVGEGGQALSGGQAQRVSIARALVREPQILVLDEPTSALDAYNAGLIRETITELTQKNYNNKYGDMAIVLVTHSKDMMRVADNIVVLDEGLKVEEGTYSELLRMRGTFASLVRGVGWDHHKKGKRADDSLSIREEN